MSAIKATFIPVSPVSPLTQLQSTIKQLEENEAARVSRHKQQRASLSARLTRSRQRLRGSIRQQTEKRTENIFKAKLEELDNLTSSITKSCYENALQTIKAVCLSVFNDYPEAYSQILQKSLDKAFSEIRSDRILQLKLPESISDKYCNYPVEISDSCSIELSSGSLLVDPIADLKAGFDSLQAKLEQSLKTSQC